MLSVDELLWSRIIISYDKSFYKNYTVVHHTIRTYTFTQQLWPLLLQPALALNARIASCRKFYKPSAFDPWYWWSTTMKYELQKNQFKHHFLFAPYSKTYTSAEIKWSSLTLMTTCLRQPGLAIIKELSLVVLPLLHDKLNGIQFVFLLEKMKQTFSRLPKFLSTRIVFLFLSGSRNISWVLFSN